MQKHPNVKTFHNYLSMTEIDGNEYYVRFTTQEPKRSKEDQLHNVYISDVKIIKAALSRHLPGLSAPTIYEKNGFKPKISSAKRKEQLGSSETLHSSDDPSSIWAAASQSKGSFKTTTDRKLIDWFNKVKDKGDGAIKKG